MASSDTVSMIALAVALVALITTIGQVLGQFLATADGYRRCQASVMGGWAKLTHRHFRWSEMRFETTYTTPRFGMDRHDQWMTMGREDARAKATPRYLLDGTGKSMRATHCDVSPDIDTTELASWVKLIEALHVSSRRLLSHSVTMRDDAPVVFHEDVSMPGQLHQIIEKVSTMAVTIGSSKNSSTQDYLYLAPSFPSVRMQKRSWDFVPPEVVRPLAVATVSEIAVMARRLGMVWKQFEPLDGNLRAEGNGYTVTSVAVRSMGTVLQIGLKDTWSASPWLVSLNELYIPSEACDQLGFGILPGDRSLDILDYKIGTEEEILATLRLVVDPTHRAADRVKGILASNPGWTPGISDIIGLAAPMIRHYHRPIVRIPQPAGYATGLTLHKEGFVVFYNRLKDLIAERDADGQAVTVQTRSILSQYDVLKQRYGDQWEDEKVCNQQLNNRSTVFLDDLHERHIATTSYFRALQRRQHPCLNYTDLMYSHIKHAVNYFPEALERINASPSQARSQYGLEATNWIVEGAHIYFDNISKVQRDMRNVGFDDPEVVEEAWLTMMFRAFLWHRCHLMVEGPRVPSEHWKSNLPVYIG